MGNERVIELLQERAYHYEKAMEIAKEKAWGYGSKEYFSLRDVFEEIEYLEQLIKEL